MAIDRLTICHWQGRAKLDTVIDDPTWQDVEVAIRAEQPQPQRLISPAEWFRIPRRTSASEVERANMWQAARFDNEYFPTIVNLQRPSEPKITLVVGGQLSDFPGSYVVDLESALLAARSFFDAGGFGADVHWVNV